MMDHRFPFQPHSPDDRGTVPAGPFEPEFPVTGTAGSYGQQPVAFGGGISQPRWWTPLAVCAASLTMFILTSFVMTIIAIVVVHGKLTADMLRQPGLLSSISASRVGLVLMVVVPQIALVAHMRRETG